MKQSMWWRIFIVVFVLGAWTFSLFPVRDRDYLATFNKMAQPRRENYQKEKAEAEALVVTLNQKIAAAKATPEEVRKLEGERAAAQAQAKTAQEPLTTFDSLMAAIQKLQDTNRKMTPYLALKQAAKGDDKRGYVQLSDYIAVPGQNRASNELVLSYVRRKAAGKFRFGMDIRGGTEFVIGFNAKDVPAGETAEGVRDRILEILRNRVDAYGVAEPEIKPVGPTSISLRMPSISEDDKADIRRIIKQTAKLQFHMVHQESSKMVAEYQNNRSAFTPEPGYEYRDMEVERDGQMKIEGIFIKGRPERVRGEDLAKAIPTFNEFGNYSVSLSFNSKGAAAFAEVTAENVGRRLAIVLDNKVFSAPVIREAISGGNAEISGSFTPEEAQQLAVVLQCGKLPVTIDIDSEFGTDPTLGADSIQAGITASIVGSAAVVLFMLVYYHFSGLVAILALAANVLLLVGTMALTGATITLPGIAGIALTIGMAVDANILIFERIREELANGKTIGNAVQAGFDRAFITIFDANITTLFSGLILYKFGTGSVKGFAITLSVGIIANIFTAVTLSRMVFDVMLVKGWMKKLTMLSFFNYQWNCNFMSYKKIFLSFSGILILASIVTAVIRGKDCLSIDFTGGTAITYRYGAGAPPPYVGDLRKVIEAAGYKDARIGYKHSGGQDERLLEVVISKNVDDSVLDKLLPLLKTNFPQANFEQVQTNRVGSLVGSKFQTNAILAVILSWLAIIIYVSFRFEFAYGVAGVVALVHDVVVAMGIGLIFGRQFSMPVLAALLTIIGYSINDTVVIFDRIRENFALRKSGTYEDIVNLSIGQTMSRTIMTSLTVFFCLVALLLLGGEANNDFSLVMLAGVVSGTYSTIFIASVIIVTWHKRVAAIEHN